MKLIAGLLLVFLLSAQGSALADVDIDDIKFVSKASVNTLYNASSLALLSTCTFPNPN